MIAAASLLQPTPLGLYCPAGDFYIDPVRPVARAVITHGHGDHARPGHGAVLATAETLAIMAVRYGAEHASSIQAASYGMPVNHGGVTLTLFPAGHVLGSAQVLVERQGARVVVSGDYKRRPDPTCPAFEPVPCDIFITEATFGLPVFRHPDAASEAGKLLASLALFPDRTHVAGVYALGKAQRLICLIRQAGEDRPIYVHGALTALTELYESLGVKMEDIRSAQGFSRDALAGALVLAPPSAINDRWARRLTDPIRVMASGWMSIRARARQSGAELPLVISDHADWDELIQTLGELRPQEVWVTHGREDALVRQASLMGLSAKPLSLAGYDDEGGEAAA